MSAKAQTKSAGTKAPQGVETEPNAAFGEIEEDVSATKTGPAMDPNLVDTDSGFFEGAEQGEEVFGASYPRFDLPEGAVSKVLVHFGETEIPMPDMDDDKKMKLETVQLAKIDGSSSIYTLPISAIFKKNFEEANVKVGDKFRVKRYPDVAKRRGRGAGNLMRCYAVKVIERAAVQSSIPSE